MLTGCFSGTFCDKRQKCQRHLLCQEAALQFPRSISDILAGIIETKEEVTTTTPLDGTPKQKCKFTLIDSQGRWLECTAIGFNAQAPALEIGKQVVLWFATALKALGNEGARCAVLNDGVIAPVTEETAMIPARGAQMLFQD